MQWRELIKSNSGILAISILSYFLSYGLNVYIARLFSPETYGDFFVTMRVLVIILPLSLMGTQVASNRFLSQYHNTDAARFLGFYRWSIKIFKISTILIWILAVGLIISVVLMEHFKVAMMADFHLATFAIWILPLLALVMLQSAFLQSIKYYNKSMASLLLYPIIMLSGLFLLHRLIPILTAYHLIALIGLAYIVIIAIQRLFIAENLDSILKTSSNTRPDFSEKKLWFSTSLGMMLNSLIGLCLANVYVLMLEIINPKEAEVGYFSAIFMITGIVILVGSSVNYVLNPLISPLLEQKKFTRLFKLIVKTTYIKAIMGGVVVIILLIYGRQLLGNFGASYVKFYPEMEIVTWAAYIYVIFSTGQALLLFSDQQALLNTISTGELILALLLTSILIPKYHLFGAILSMAISMSFSSIISAAIAIFLFSKRTKVN